MKKEKNREFLEHFVEQPQPPEPETVKTPEDSVVVDRKRNWALLRYIAIMFCVAFVLVFMSLYFTTRRDSQQTISQLNQNASSALAKAEQLQNDNRELTVLNTTLQKQVNQLEADLKAAQDTATAQEEKIDAMASEVDQVKKENERLTKEKDNTLKACSLLVQAQLAYGEGKTEECTAILEELSEFQKYLDQDGKKLHDQLLKGLAGNNEN